MVDNLFFVDCLWASRISFVNKMYSSSSPFCCYCFCDILRWWLLLLLSSISTHYLCAISDATNKQIHRWPLTIYKIENNNFVVPPIYHKRSVLQQFSIILVELYILYEAWWNRYRGRVVSGECLWVLVWPQIQRYLFMWLYNNDSKTRQPLIPPLLPPPFTHFSIQFPTKHKEIRGTLQKIYVYYIYYI